MYQVPCKDCNRTYIGETKRTLKVRFEEHKQEVRRGDPNNGIPVPAHETHMRWTGMVPELRVLHLITGREESWKPCRLRSVVG